MIGFAVTVIILIGLLGLAAHILEVIQGFSLLDGRVCLFSRGEVTAMVEHHVGSPCVKGAVQRVTGVI